MRIVRLVLVNFVLALAIGTASVAGAAPPATVQFGAADGANAVMVFNGSAKAPTIVLRTMRAGVAGSRIELTVDQDKKPVFSHIFTPGECKFGAGGSTCEVSIPARTAAYRTLLARFRRGREARVTLQDAGITKMDHTASFSGASFR